MGRDEFRLEPWQQFLVWVLFGWLRDDGLRRYRTAYIEVPRKNGKSTWVAGLGLYLMVGDGEPGAEVFAAATKRDQARIVHSEATRMVQASPDLRRMVRRVRDNLSIPATASKFEPLGADTNSMDGLNVHGGLIDELHAHRTPSVVELLETATGARRQPLLIEITTAGYDRTSICWEHHEYTRQILEGLVQDDTWFGVMYTIDEDDDWRDPATWAKANPNLGVSVKLDDLERKAAKAKAMPIAQNAFKRLHLDVWTQQSDRWIDLELWDAAAGDEERRAEDYLAGSTCYGGLDLASVSDLCAWVMLFPRDDSDDLTWSHGSGAQRLSSPTRRTSTASSTRSGPVRAGYSRPRAMRLTIALSNNRSCAMRRRSALWISILTGSSRAMAWRWN